MNSLNLEKRKKRPDPEPSKLRDWSGVIAAAITAIGGVAVALIQKLL